MLRPYYVAGHDPYAGETHSSEQNMRFLLITLGEMEDTKIILTNIY